MSALERFRPLFDPRGVIVAGASTHPGKFGFVAAHNLLRQDYRGRVFLINRDGADVLGTATFRSVDELPDGAAELVFVCTPAAVVPDLLRACARKGVRAAFVSSAGYGEAGPEGKHAQDELVALCRELGVVLAGPNGQGVVSTPSALCAQIVAPYPPAGRIAVASQSGNFVSSFLNYACATGVGVSRAVSAGNSAATTVADYLEYFADDPATAVSLTYVEGIADGRSFFERLRAVAARKPLVLLKGGVTRGGQRAAASHTGALASDDRVFDGMCRQAGVTRAYTVEEAFEAAAAFVTQPLPAGPNVFVLTTAGGWGVVTADRIVQSRVLTLLPLPDDLRAAFDARLPPRWSRNNPADLAGSETRDTVTECLELAAGHPDVHAVLLLGLGIQSNQAALERGGRFYPAHGLERIVAYHERQDRRVATATIELAAKYDKPVLVATELAVTHPSNPGVAQLRELGGFALPSSYRAVAALEHLVRYARFRRRRASPDAATQGAPS
jgi:acyl-CoA synthetase (NDP forming)